MSLDEYCRSFSERLPMKSFFSFLSHEIKEKRKKDVLRDGVRPGNTGEAVEDEKSTATKPPKRVSSPLL